MAQEPLNTISGSSAIHCDSIPSLLAERLDHLSLYGPLFEALEKNHFSKPTFGGGKPECQLEIEVRLGFIKNVRSDHRYTLPLTTDTLLATRAPVKFVAGVSEDQYNAAKNFLVDTVENEKAESEWDTTLNSSSINRFFELAGYEELVRISVENQNSPNRQSKEGIDAIRKVNLLKWNISSGSTEEVSEESEEYVTQDSLDYRIAVNLEYKVPLTNLPTTTNAKHCRRRQRDSFVNKAGKLRFDLSRVEDVTDVKESVSTSPPTFEIEIELEGEEIIKNLTNNSISQEEKLMNLKYHCATLISSCRYIRDLICCKNQRMKYSSFLNSISDKVGHYDLRIAAQEEESIKRYKRYLSPQLPLIGDYLYRTVARDLEANPELNKERSSLYVKNLEAIPGPYLVKLNEEGRKIVTLGK